MLRPRSFLQGKATAPEAVNSIRSQLEHTDEVLQLVLNYRSSGAPFLNLLYILPLRDREGNIAYFLGAQVDQTRALTTGTDLSLILPEDQDLRADMTSFSPAVQVEAHDVAKRPVPPTKEALDEEIPLLEGEGDEEKRRDEQRGGGGSGRTTSVVQEMKEDVGLSIRKLLPCFGGGKKREGRERREGGEEGGRDEQEESTTGGEPRASSEEGQLVPPLQKESRKVSLEQRMLDIQVTYERVSIVKRTSKSPFYRIATPLTQLSRSARDPLHVGRLLALAWLARHDSPGSRPLTSRLPQPPRLDRCAVGAERLVDRDEGAEGIGQDGFRAGQDDQPHLRLPLQA